VHLPRHVRKGCPRNSGGKSSRLRFGKREQGGRVLDAIQLDVNREEKKVSAELAAGTLVREPGDVRTTGEIAVDRVRERRGLTSPTLRTDRAEVNAAREAREQQAAARSSGEPKPGMSKERSRAAENRSVGALRAGRYDEALTALEEAAAADPEGRPEVWEDRRRMIRERRDAAAARAATPAPTPPATRLDDATRTRYRDRLVELDRAVRDTGAALKAAEQRAARASSTPDDIHQLAEARRRRDAASADLRRFAVEADDGHAHPDDADEWARYIQEVAFSGGREGSAADPTPPTPEPAVVSPATATAAGSGKRGGGRAASPKPQVAKVVPARPAASTSARRARRSEPLRSRPYVDRHNTNPREPVNDEERDLLAAIARGERPRGAAAETYDALNEAGLIKDDPKRGKAGMASWVVTPAGWDHVEDVNLNDMGRVDQAKARITELRARYANAKAEQFAQEALAKAGVPGADVRARAAERNAENAKELVRETVKDLENRITDWQAKDAFADFKTETNKTLDQEIRVAAGRAVAEAGVAVPEGEDENVRPAHIPALTGPADVAGLAAGGGKVHTIHGTGEVLDLADGKGFYVILDRNRGTGPVRYNDATYVKFSDAWIPPGRYAEQLDLLGQLEANKKEGDKRVAKISRAGDLVKIRAQRLSAKTGRKVTPAEVRTQMGAAASVGASQAAVEREIRNVSDSVEGRLRRSEATRGDAREDLDIAFRNEAIARVREQRGLTSPTLQTTDAVTVAERKESRARANAARLDAAWRAAEAAEDAQQIRKALGDLSYGDLKTLAEANGIDATTYLSYEAFQGKIVAHILNRRRNVA
jgi:hypothetical protein